MNLGPQEQVTQTQRFRTSWFILVVRSLIAQFANIMYIHVPVVILILLMELFDWSVWKMALGRGLEVASRKATGETDNTRQSNSLSNSKRRKQNVKSETVKRPTIRCRALLCQTKKQKTIKNKKQKPKKQKTKKQNKRSRFCIHFKHSYLFQRKTADSADFTFIQSFSFISKKNNCSKMHLCVVASPSGTSVCWTVRL